ncbi:MAG: hypothetical protein LBU75_12155 [Desulfovibrio sp.]|jgi:methionyl-tRNA formyltransferase|nr:hypothetical protein [Desulfovibrio sp.]
MVTAPLRVLLAANWGLGERLLDALLACPEVALLGVVTRCAPVADDPWADAACRRARAAGLSVWDERQVQPTGLGQLVHDLEADVLWLHAYMRLLPRPVYTAARLGTVNVHASLLPAYRGPAPHHHVLRNRDPETGLTSHFVDDGVDTGPIIHQVRLGLRGDETLADLLDTLKEGAAPLVRGTVENLLDPAFHPVPQDASLATYAPVMEGTPS